jgi:hypothetical protein
MAYKKSHDLYAKRQALNILDRWIDVTGVINKFSGYYDELCGIVESAVVIGSMVALDIPFTLNDEDEPEELMTQNQVVTEGEPLYVECSLCDGMGWHTYMGDKAEPYKEKCSWCSGDGGYWLLPPMQTCD